MKKKVGMTVTYVKEKYVIICLVTRNPPYASLAVNFVLIIKTKIISKTCDNLVTTFIRKFSYITFATSTLVKKQINCNHETCLACCMNICLRFYFRVIILWISIKNIQFIL